MFFLTKNHDHGTTDAIWIVKKYDPKSHFVQFYKIEPEYKIGVVTVKLYRTGILKNKDSGDVQISCPINSRRGVYCWVQ